MSRLPGFAPNTQQGGDGGTDGRATLAVAPDDIDSRLALAQVKGGRFNVSYLRDFRYVMEREAVAVGCFITLDPAPAKHRGDAKCGAGARGGPSVRPTPTVVDGRLLRPAATEAAGIDRPVHGTTAESVGTILRAETEKKSSIGALLRHEDPPTVDGGKSCAGRSRSTSDRSMWPRSMSASGAIGPEAGKASEIDGEREMWQIRAHGAERTSRPKQEKGRPGAQGGARQRRRRD